MSTLYRNEGHFATVARQKARRAVVAGKARWLHSRPKSVEVCPAEPTVKHPRTPFGYGILASRPTYRLDCTLTDYEWWQEESRREEDRLVDRLAAESAAMDRMEMGLEPY